MNDIFMLGVKLMLYGLAGVFTTLILFILMIVGLTKAFPFKKQENEKKD